MDQNRRDDFKQGVKDVLAHRAGFRCSKPDCRAATAGPHSEDIRTMSVGVAAHITAAARGGARYDETLTPEQRGSVLNGIWLCATHAREIDVDVVRFTVDVLHAWKTHAEEEARAVLGRSLGGLPLDVLLEVSLQRDANDGLLVVGETNLPDGAKLMGDLRAEGYFAQAKGTVFDRRVLLGPFRNGDEILPQRWYQISICSYFNAPWEQPDHVLAIAGENGSKLAGRIVRALDPELEETDFAVDAGFDCPAPPPRGEAQLTSDEVSGAIDILRSATLDVQGHERTLSNDPVGRVVATFMSFPGLREADGWNSAVIAPGIVRVTYSYWDGDSKAVAAWDVVPRSNEARYRNRAAKTLSWTPDD